MNKASDNHTSSDSLARKRKIEAKDDDAKKEATSKSEQDRGRGIVSVKKEGIFLK